ncbi:MAG TPA: hypothetical protein VNL69_00790 [Bacteroidota bacterium]|nr:hypothetical protein [Bacteroidota bacterium]
MPNKIMRLKKGVNLPSFTAQLLRASFPVNISDANTITLIWRPVDNSAAAKTDEMDVIDAQSGKVEKVWDANDLDTGSFKAEIKIAWNDGKIERFPSDGYIYFDVIPTVD